MDRQTKLAKLRTRQPVKIDSDNLEKTINRLIDKFGEGLEITNIDELLNKIEQLNSFKDDIKNLKDSIDQIEYPDSLEIRGLNDIVKALKDIKSEANIQTIDIRPITKQLNNISKKLNAQTVIKQSTSDYVPMRRVVAIGNQLIYDDNLTGNNVSGGGSASAFKNSAGDAEQGLVDSESNVQVLPVSGLLPMKFDDITFTNADANGNYQTGTVKSSGSTVAILTLTYDVDSKLTRITRT